MPQRRLVSLPKDKEDLKRRAKIVGASYVGVRVARRPTTNFVRGRVYRQDWIRPNGEVVKLRGFKPSEIQAMHGALSNIDSRLGDRHTVNVKRISKKDFSWNAKRRGVIGGQRGSMIKLSASKDLADPEFVQHVLAHELAHGIDKGKGKRANQFVHSRGEFARVAGWRMSSGDRRAVTQNKAVDFEQMRRIAGGNNYRKQSRNILHTYEGTYQGHRVHEDFAESFAHAVNRHSPENREIILTPGREKYFSRHLLTKHGEPIQANVHKVSYHGQAYNTIRAHPKSTVAIVAGVGAGAYAYHHREDIKRKFEQSKDYYYRHHNGKQIRVRKHR